MTRSELRARILDGLNDAAGIFVTPAQADAMIGDALDVMAEESGAVKRTVHLALQSGTMLYSLSAVAADAMSPYRLWLVGEERRLTAVSMRDLDHRHETWPTVTRQPEYWFPVSWDLFGLWPHPSTGGGLLRIDYLAWPRALMDDGDEPEFQLGDHDAIVDYGIYEGLAKRWDVARMLEVWSRFGARVGFSRARTGAGRVQARSFRTGQADDDAGFTSGVTR